jgi:hypothetical protein
MTLMNKQSFHTKKGAAEEPQAPLLLQFSPDCQRKISFPQPVFISD